jgi:hypothetical protein
MESADSKASRAWALASSAGTVFSHRSCKMPAVITISGIRPRLGARSSSRTVAWMSIRWLAAGWTVPSIHGPACSRS